MDPATSSLLNHVLVREEHSLLQYLSDAWPWTDSAHADTPGRLSKMAAEERTAIRRLADWLLRRKVMPLRGQFPKDYCTLHFVAMDHLLPRLVASERQLLKELERDAAKVDVEEASAILKQMLESKRRHGAELEQLAGQLNGKMVSTLR